MKSLKKLCSSGIKLTENTKRLNCRLPRDIDWEIEQASKLIKGGGGGGVCWKYVEHATERRRRAISSFFQGIMPRLIQESRIYNIRVKALCNAPTMGKAKQWKTFRVWLFGAPSGPSLVKIMKSESPVRKNNTLLIPPSSFHEVESPNCSPNFGFAEIWLCFPPASEQIRTNWHFVRFC